MTELWLRDPKFYAAEALATGFRRFSWQVPQLLQGRAEALSWLRAAAIGYGDNVQLMLIDYAGAPVYSIFNSYKNPQAVYPTWTPDEGMTQLLWLIANNVGDNPDFTEAEDVPPEMRPIAGQKHRIVIHRIGQSNEAQKILLLKLRELQLANPHCELFISGLTNYSAMFDFDFAAADYRPICLRDTGAITKCINLPTGKYIHVENVYDSRYKDWFSLVGYSQLFLIHPDRFLECNLLMLKWAEKNFKRVTPFVFRLSNKPQPTVPTEWLKVSDKDIILPAGRRRLMRNIGVLASDLDQFQCDTCILQNACTLYREGSVCTVKGSATVDLAENFGTRNSSAIIAGLGALLKRQAERLEDAQAIEDSSGEIDPNVTKMYASIFQQGVTLAKLIDPSLTKPAVQVNVNGAAQPAVAEADPRQLVAAIIGELESAGIKREDITSSMLKGVLTALGKGGEPAKRQAITAVAVGAGKTVNGHIL